jgi:hypothetical protein
VATKKEGQQIFFHLGAGRNGTGTSTDSESPTCMHHSDFRSGIKTGKGNHKLTQCQACLFNDNIEGVVPKGHSGHVHGDVGLWSRLLIAHVVQHHRADVNVRHVAPAHCLQLG